MAADRFYFWRGYYDAMRKLDERQCGRFVMAMCEYAFDGIEPDFSDDERLDFAWTLICDQVCESVEIGRRRSEAGRRSGESRRSKADKKQRRKRSKKHTSEQCSEQCSEHSIERNVYVYGAARHGADAPPLAQSDEAIDWYDENGVTPPVPAEQP